MRVPTFKMHGSKARMAKWIISYFPTDFDLYAEPFAGRGNLFFRLASLRNLYCDIHLNDKYMSHFLQSLLRVKEFDFVDEIADRSTFDKWRNSKPSLERDLAESYLEEHIINKSVGIVKSGCFIPAFTKNDKNKRGMLMRGCTRDYKIDVINKFIKREIFGLLPRRRMKNLTVDCLIGISMDEIQRMKNSKLYWSKNIYPLITARMNRKDCENLLINYGFSIPKKSSCSICPYHSDAYWIDLKTNYPDEFNKVCCVDEQIRNSQKAMIKHDAYLHSSLVPLRDVKFTNNPDLEINECEGGCFL